MKTITDADLLQINRDLEAEWEEVTKGSSGPGAAWEEHIRETRPDKRVTRYRMEVSIDDPLVNFGCLIVGAFLTVILITREKEGAGLVQDVIERQGSLLVGTTTLIRQN